MNKLFLAFLLFGLIASAFSLNIQMNAAPKQKNLKDIPLCLICSFAVDKIEGYLENHSNTTVIVDSAEKDCKILEKSQWISKCTSIIGQYGPEIIELLENKESPEAICKVIELC